MTYAEKVKLLREVMLVTQAELASILGVSFITVNRWENGKNQPTIKIKRKLQALFEKYMIK